ncbi:hypothetical protein [Flavisolibacter tropicus]|uniref:Uncharacterized protein n=1 Tax=Flavisolibacter tropicus TaxID=1492898 RepID=A0A172TTP1_9BACT|nr:hypothetical protein [Flavisolibacter tropicus]ANE50400.1 hypothetical protein SY85_07730 [Flavisolibacter tropicus]
MARQAGPLFITGTIDDMVFYKMGDKYYMRLKDEPTPGTKKRMSQDEHYPLLCLRKREFKEASKMVRKWYYTLPKTVRKQGLFGTLTGKAVRWLRQGKTEEEIKALGLKAALPKQKETETVKEAKPVEKAAVKEPVMQELSNWCVTASGGMNIIYVEKRAQRHASPPTLAVLPNTNTPPD